jgi:hypothetical protein
MNKNEQLISNISDDEWNSRTKEAFRVHRQRRAEILERIKEDKSIADSVRSRPA